MKRLIVCLLLATACYAAPKETPYAPLTTFPELGPARRVERGIVVHQVSLPGRVWIYLPEKLPTTPLPCIFIAPAGVPPFLGESFGPDLYLQKHPEHLPYVHAGFAVVAYDLDGALANRNDATFDEVKAAAQQFKNADAGMTNARHAIDYVVKMVPAIDPRRLYSAGHSSGGRISLLLAESDPRIAACVAYAPVTDVERRVRQNFGDAGRYLEENLNGFRAFLRSSSPLQQRARLTVPAFVFHAEDDRVIPIADTAAFVKALQKTNPRVTFVRVPSGDHYDSMIEEGVPQAIRWLKER
ncbi:MAG TPA: prolyl oligopeptidase family serine peptidase [Thermoanaerobaculia bacterium]|nr:prolyl oligopeptidase family serine peptidase [Thermoanaerobaculia bacterium]